VSDPSPPSSSSRIPVRDTTRVLARSSAPMLMLMTVTLDGLDASLRAPARNNGKISVRSGQNSNFDVRYRGYQIANEYAAILRFTPDRSVCRRGAVGCSNNRRSVTCTKIASAKLSLNRYHELVLKKQRHRLPVRLIECI
jgi:hypothetical protein